MRLAIAILLALFAGTFDSNGEKQAKYHTIYWKNRLGGIAYEAKYEVTFVGRFPMLKLAESYRHGPFAYKCMAPESINHGNGIYIRNYLRQPTLCYVPTGYKVCLQPAFVKQGPVNVLPYLYLGENGPCKTEQPFLFDLVFYRPATLIPARL
jgi:hypothetical protein